MRYIPAPEFVSSIAQWRDSAENHGLAAGELSRTLQGFGETRGHSPFGAQ